MQATEHAAASALAPHPAKVPLCHSPLLEQLGLCNETSSARPAHVGTSDLSDLEPDILGDLLVYVKLRCRSSYDDESESKDLTDGKLMS